jgi:hypothetical protein
MHMAIYNGRIDNEARGCIARLRSAAQRSGFGDHEIAQITLELPARVFDAWIPPDGDASVFVNIQGIKVRRLTE